MKKSNFTILVSLILSIILVSCGGSTSNTTTSNSQSVGGAILGDIVQNAISNNTNTSVNTGTLISGLIGQLTNSSSTATSIVGKWSYVEPTIQFESENLLAKAGGALASKSIINKIDPYYKKVGITSGALVYVFNSDNTCTYTLKGKTFNGTYAYNSKAHTLTITSPYGTNVLNAYVTVSANDMAVTFESSKLLTFLQKATSASSNTTISTISGLSKSYNGMKTGFLMKKM